MMEQVKVTMAFFPYIPAAVNFLEKWLCKKAYDGWRLEEIHGWRFVFRKCTPYMSRFFAYSSFGASMGMWNDYLHSKDRYALKKSPLNKANWGIYEVDPKKINSEFYHLVLMRNKLYLKHYSVSLIVSIVYTVLSIVLMLVNPMFFLLLAIGIIFLGYSIFSVSVLAYEIKHSQRAE